MFSHGGTFLWPERPALVAMPGIFRVLRICGLRASRCRLECILVAPSATARDVHIGGCRDRPRRIAASGAPRTDLRHAPARSCRPRRSQVSRGQPLCRRSAWSSGSGNAPAPILPGMPRPRTSVSRAERLARNDTRVTPRNANSWGSETTGARRCGDCASVDPASGRPAGECARPSGVAPAYTRSGPPSSGRPRRERSARAGPQGEGSSVRPCSSRRTAASRATNRTSDQRSCSGNARRARAGYAHGSQGTIESPGHWARGRLPLGRLPKRAACRTRAGASGPSKSRTTEVVLPAALQMRRAIKSR